MREQERYKVVDKDAKRKKKKRVLKESTRKADEE